MEPKQARFDPINSPTPFNIESALPRALFVFKGFVLFSRLEKSITNRWVKSFGWACFSLLIILSATIFLMHGFGYRIGVDAQRLAGEPACLPNYLFIWSKTDGSSPHKGDYIVAKMPRNYFGVGARKGDRIIKIVMGVPGDKVRVEGTELWINDQHIDRLWLAKSLPGKEIGDFDMDITLEEHQYFVMGTTKESFDSRYWGPIARENIIGSATPLL